VLEKETATEFGCAAIIIVTIICVTILIIHFN
jgi:hypothetical protein